MSLHFFSAPAARDRIEAALTAMSHVAPADRIVIVGASRAAADELAFVAASRRGGLFGVTRVGLAELVTKLALLALARQGLSPTGGLGAEAVAARATFTTLSAGRLTYFAPVADLPGFPRALTRTMAELRLGHASAAELAALAGAGADLAELAEAVAQESRNAGAVDRATLLETATAAVQEDDTIARGAMVVLLDIPIASLADERLIAALTRAARAVFATVPHGDDRTLNALRNIHFTETTAQPGSAPARALARLQQHLFATGSVPSGEMDDSVVMFSAPGEGRECVEIARRVLEEAARGVPYDEMAVLLRAPQIYLGLLEHAFQRAGIPSWFDRGTRRPDPAGRAFLALLACADEDLSARRFAEYLSLGQVPPAGEPPADPWSPPSDEIAEAVVPDLDRSVDREPEEEARSAASEPARDGVMAGSLRAPWRWEELLVESAVIGHFDRWERRLRGLAEEYRRKMEELESDEPESPRIPALGRDREQLAHLRAFALPLVQEMAGWPRGAEWTWGQWLTTLRALAPQVLRQPARVLRVLTELGPLAGVGPVSLGEVRDVLAPRLLMLTHDPPRRRHGRVFVGVPSAVRGRSSRVVFVPGLAERVFPQRLREDALLLDERRQQLSAPLLQQKQRADEERLHLRLAVGAASERIYLSWPRVELQESRQRVPSFYVLDIARAVEGRIPPYAAIRDRAFAAGGATLAWPAPEAPERAIDEFEHDLAMLHQLLHDDRGRVKGRGRYLYELSPHLQRSLTGRWARWQKRWHPADGLIRATPQTAPALARQRLGARPFSLSALQRFAECPYQFQLSAVFRLAPLEAPAPLQRLDPLTRGSLFHQIQAEFFRELEKNGLLPLTDSRAAAGRKMLEWAIGRVSRKAKDDLAPAIDRVWSDELASIARDLRGWLDHLVRDGREWKPELFEFAFGLPGDLERDPRSVNDPAQVNGRFLIRGSIDLVERRLHGTALRVTDHKTGKNRTTRATMVDGGRVLQPILYGMALEAVTGEHVEEGRLSYCTSVGGFSVHSIALDDTSRRRALEVLEVIDRAIEQGTLAARPADGACRRCDFVAVCGGDEERRTRRKSTGLFADLDALRRIP
ncbi:MAG TPA: PD-(D/E)XK nuclease family protein [Vicinamibacterales bacterium]|nr:PD-(D/E)XK nuclease family protein [Vicinamibacterales bacterium]